jgi:hypothetical protein
MGPNPFGKQTRDPFADAGQTPSVFQRDDGSLYMLIDGKEIDYTGYKGDTTSWKRPGWEYPAEPSPNDSLPKGWPDAWKYPKSSLPEMIKGGMSGY